MAWRAGWNSFSNRRRSRAHVDTTTIRLAEVFSLSSPKGGEGGGEEATILLNASHPNPLPTRSSRGEGENFWWLCRCARRGTQQILTQKPDALIPLIPAAVRLRGEFQIERKRFFVRLIRL